MFWLCVYSLKYSLDYGQVQILTIYSLDYYINYSCSLLLLNKKHFMFKLLQDNSFYRKKNQPAFTPRSAPAFEMFYKFNMFLCWTHFYLFKMVLFGKLFYCNCADVVNSRGGLTRTARYFSLFCCNFSFFFFLFVWYHQKQQKLVASKYCLCRLIVNSHHGAKTVAATI